MIATAILVAIALDWWLGDPYTWPHPIKWIGSFIGFLTKQQDKWRMNGWLFGGVLFIVTTSLTGVLTWSLLYATTFVHPILYWFVWIYLAYASLAGKCLADEAKKVQQTLQNGTIEEARYQVSMIVGRETSQLSHEEICHATIETVAENTSDGVIGPLICLFIGGPVLAMVYKAINTLDSMVGYKTEKYRQIGFVSAKIDDLANLIPARFTMLCMLVSSWVLGYDGKQTAKIAWRDRYQHASPNSAFPEAVVAGALGIQLGGGHVYHGEYIDKPTIGDATRIVETQDIQRANQLLYVSTLVAYVLLITITRYLF